MPMTHLKTPKHKFSTHLINVDDIEKNRGIIEEKHTHKDIYIRAQMAYQAIRLTERFLS